MKKIFSVIIGIGLLFALGTFIWIKQSLMPVAAADKTQKIFVVAKGTGIKAIGNALYHNGLIKSPLVFYLTVKRLGIENNIQAGDFRLSPSMDTIRIAKSLTQGSLDLWITIPEGKRAEEVADLLKEQVPAYDPTWIESLVKQEGYLFPDTYMIPRNADLSIILKIFQRNFDIKYSQLNLNPANSLTKQQIVIIASMIEREARHVKDQPLVASVIFNRMRINMPLQIDATVQYALGYQPDAKRWWKKDLTFQDLKISSPFNTYTNIGLPPGPIASPGLSALQAAVNPAKTNYLYYISDKSGQNHYAKTIEEHNANIKKYGL